MNRFAEQFEATKRSNTKVVFIIDEDDPLKDRYLRKNLHNHDIFVARQSARGMVGALNQGFRSYEKFGRLGFAIGFMGDDHRPRTEGWDVSYLQVLASFGTGFVYGNDLLQGMNLPTQVAFTTDIGRALGYMCPPDLLHLNVDNYWRDLGRQLRIIEYLPDVIVEHMHPIAGKSQMDKNYRAVNNVVVANHDASVYDEFHKSGRFAEDVGRVKMLLENGWTEPWD